MAISLTSPVTFLKDVRHELKSVQWPSRTTTLRFTALIIVVTAVVAIATGAFDFALTFAIEQVVAR